MNTQNDIEMVTKSDILGLDMASWDRQRSTEYLLNFISRREAEIFNTES
jgi:hypothetical protein